MVRAIRCLCVVFLVSIWIPAVAAQEAPSLDGLSQVLAGMGYEVTPASDGKSLKFASGGYTVTANRSNTGKSTYLYIYLADFAPDRFAKLDTFGLLKESDRGIAYFSMAHDDSRNAEALFLNCNFPTGTETPQVLRNIIDELTGAAERSRPLWEAPA